MNFKTKPKTNEEYISVKYGCIRYVDSYRFLSSSLDPLVKLLVDNSHKTMKKLNVEIVDNDETLFIVNGVKFLFKEDRDNNDSIKDLKKDYPDKITKLEEAFFNLDR